MKRPDVVGTAEAAKILGVPTPVVNRKMKAEKMPPPAAEGAATTLWHRADVERIRDGGDPPKTARPLPLVGTSEVAQICGVNKSQIGRWKRKNPRFPKPVVEVAAGPFWMKSDIEKFVEERRKDPVPAVAS